MLAPREGPEVSLIRHPSSVAVHQAADHAACAQLDGEVEEVALDARDEASELAHDDQVHADLPSPGPPAEVGAAPPSAGTPPFQHLSAQTTRWATTMCAFSAISMSKIGMRTASSARCASSPPSKPASAKVATPAPLA